MEKVRATRRRHSAELKARILAACAEPGASVARVAMENGLNANLVFKWRRHAAAKQVARNLVPVTDFVPLPVGPAPSVPASDDIRISIRRGGTTLDIEWPVSGAESCAQWLRELLR
jgi:transposase